MLSIHIPNIPMTREEFEKLHERCTSGGASLEEQQLFEEYKDNFDLTDIPWMTEMGDYEAARQKFQRDLNQRLADSEPKRIKLWHWSVAASIVIAMGLGIALLKYSNAPEPAKQVRIVTQIEPGVDKATLILANGRKVLLEDSGKNLISKEANVTILKDQDNTLTYQSHNQESLSQEQIFNTLITPRGGQYALKLSDGTKVWLNADSRLQFPVNFSAKERVVRLTGEAYFEVVKNKAKPFKVITDQKTVEVLGTSFNVSAYSNEPYQATLLTGAVKLVFGDGLPVELSPGKQATLNSKHKFDIIEVNAADAIAWTKGLFLFENENIHQVMQKIARWYDVEVEYKGNVDRKKLGGSVSRYEDFRELLKAIELTGNVHFKTDGRRVTVMP